MKNRNKYILAVASGLLFGLSFPPVPAGILATVAFVPLLFVLMDVDSYADCVRYSYVTFLFFNIVALYWTGGFTHGRDVYLMIAGGMLIVAHPFFFLIPIVAWFFVKKRFGFFRALAALPFLWTAFEKLHAVGEIGFPWLTIGNSQSTDISAIQIASFIGVYGLSLWIVLLNLIAFLLVFHIIIKRFSPFSPKVLLLGVGFLLLYIGPKIIGIAGMANSIHDATESQSLSIGLVQPNIDPFEKWQGQADPQLNELQRMTDELRSRHIGLIIWPETAVPFFILHPANRHYFIGLRRQVDSIHTPLLTGIPDIVYYDNGSTAPRSSKKLPNGGRYDTFNSTLLLRPDTDSLQKYSKMILVPFAERVPFSEELSFLNAMQWNFGLGGWAIGKDSTLFHIQTGGRETRFCNLICYESVYPDFVADFVRRGAMFITVTTNDSWWGKTSGAYQHEQIGVLRAVENRRWVVQCANGGISCFIDPFGRIFNATDLFEKTISVGEIVPRVETSFYTLHSALVPDVCETLSAFFIVAALGDLMYSRLRKLSEKN